MADEKYHRALHDLQVGLVGLQRHVIAENVKVLIIFEGRDTAGKDGVIKRIVEHMSPRDVRVVALGKPTSHEQSEWYFQRYARHLPGAGEIVLFNRSWYNRAGVEHVMNFCTEQEYEDFLEAAPRFERMLTQSGIRIIKYYLDITAQEQAQRLKERRKDPLKQWKISPIDESAQEKWKPYSKARNVMLKETDHDDAPWFAVRANDKQEARLNVIRHILGHLDHPERDEELTRVDRHVLRRFKPALIKDSWLAP